MNLNQTHQLDFQQQNSGFSQNQTRMQTEPTQINENTNSLQNMTFNSNKFRKELQQQQQQLQQQQSLQASQMNLASQNQQISKWKQSNNLNKVQLPVSNVVQQNTQQQQQTQSVNNVTDAQLMQQNQSNNSQKVSSRVRSNHSYLSGQQLTNNPEISQPQQSIRFFQPVYDLFFEIQRKLDKEEMKLLKLNFKQKQNVQLNIID